MRSARLLWLLALCAVPTGAQATVLYLLRIRPSLGQSVLATAPAPYGSLRDMLWVLVYHDSWLGFVLELAAAILLRGLLNAGIVALAWPGEVPRPTARRLVGRNIAFAAVCAVLMSPWAALGMAAVAVALSWFAFGELVPVVMFALVVQRGGICPGWWRGVPSLRLVGLALLNALILTVTGTLVWRAPDGWAVPAAVAAGALNGVLWWYLVRTAVLRPVRVPRLPTVPIVAGIVVVGLFLVGAGAGFGGSGGGHRSVPPPAAPQAEGALRRHVLYIAGYDSAYDGRTTPDPQFVSVFSYRGLDSAGNPLPYEPATTHQSLETSAALLAEQVNQVHQRTGKPVALVGLSEGALVTRKYLAAWPHPGVDAAALVSPVARPGQVYYPPAEAGHGWGLAAGWELRGILAVVGLHHATPISADEPFVRSVFTNAPLFRNQMLCPVAGVRMLAFLPSADAATIPPGAFNGIPADSLPSLHGGLVGEPAEQQRLVTFLNGGEVESRQRHYYSLVQQATGVWQAPVLALSVNPVWRAPDQPDAAFYGEACPTGR